MKTVHKYLRLCCASVGVWLCLSTTATADIINDLTSDWSVSAGLPVLAPEWSLTYDGGQLLPGVANVGGLDFYPVAQPGFQADFVPAWFQAAFDGADFTNPANIEWEIGDIVVHTDQTRGATSAIWTSNLAGLVDIAGSLWNPRDFDRAQEYTITVNGVVLASGTITDATGRDNRELFDVSSILVGIGDQIALNLSTLPGSVEDYVGVTFAISDAVSVPEPGTLALLGIGLFGMRLARRKI